MTEPSVVPEVEQENPEDEGQGRSTIRFPYLDQDDAVKLARAIHSVAGNSCSRDALAGYLKVSAKAGGFNLRTGTAKMFGLVESDKGMFSLTDLGKRAINPKQERAARAESFLLIPLYKRVFDDFRNQILPGNQALEKAMEQMGVAPKQADKARQAFQRSASQAGFFAFGNDRLIAPQGAPAQTDAPPPPPPPDEKLNNGKNGGGGEPPHTNPFIQGLLNKLPPEDSVWSTDQRRKWLQLAISVFEVSYKTAENDTGELSVTLTKPQTNSAN